ncbi:YEATS domain-containing protein [Lasiodiplodia theobromae]|uniref:Protein AF-9 homolog n=1 Tax=Lasiodiplodia hormozganensis TaxID=869390 RepID=A0AA39Y3D1_9PEZI|nr:Histone acetyltransferase subunit [Lasiodiplodia theobromae]KAF4541537.1 Histone acetyltransferase subunit [Lasiodiplodia theobromae]KAF9641000.1 YEATS domain-containing protein [Lasiodiplodia theobromae]KAK0645268.1 Protein AF-9-like protein [Lasiodiplodia hormozganensis]
MPPETPQPSLHHHGDSQPVQQDASSPSHNKGTPAALASTDAPAAAAGPAQQPSSAGNNGVADSPRPPPATSIAPSSAAQPPQAGNQQDPARPLPAHGTPQQASPTPQANTPTSLSAQHPEKSDSNKHKRSSSSARPTPSRTPTSQSSIPIELIPAELRGDFAPGVWEPANQKRRTHSRNVSLAEPKSSDEEDGARNRRKSSHPLSQAGSNSGTGRKRSAPENTTTLPHRASSGGVDDHHSASARKKTTAQQNHHHHSHSHSLSSSLAQHAHTPAGARHQHAQSLPHIDTSIRHRRTATLNSTPSTPYSAMVGLSDKKRVKGVKITRAFRIGSEAWKLDDKNRPPGIPEDHTTGWRVYVENVDGGPDMSTWLNKVQFSLHETYPNNKRMIANPPFEVRETGWGGFTVEIRLYFQPYVGEKHAVRSHYLYLEPYGPPESAERQRAANLVKAEILDFIEFNEPTEVLYAALTDEERQWPPEGTGRGKGKGAAAAAAQAAAQRKLAGQEERSVELPERGMERNPYSKQMEETFIRLFKQAEVDVDKQIEELTKRKEKVEARRRELIASGDLDVGKKKR